jgi:putative two-component system response regulator
MTGNSGVDTPMRRPTTLAASGDTSRPVPMVSRPSLPETPMNRTPESSEAVLPVSMPLESFHARQVLVVDDEESIRKVLEKFMVSKGYDVKTAPDGPSGLALLERHKFVLMICDLRMPKMNGQEVVMKALGIDPDLAIITLSGINDAVTATEVLAMGASDYLVKPVELESLRHAVERSLQKRHLRVEQRKVERLIRDTVILRTVELEKEKVALREMTVSIAQTLINAMEAKDVCLRGHSQRVADLAASIAQELGLDEDMVERVRLAGRLHDVGKIGIREDVLNKPGALTAEEFEHVRTSVTIGMDILRPLQHLGDVLDFVHDHHEQVDGKGYPRGLKGTRISIGGRILSVADAFDALTSRRAFREPLSPRESLDTMAGQVGTRFDRDVFAALCKLKSRRSSVVFLDDFVAQAERQDAYSIPLSLTG